MQVLLTKHVKMEEHSGKIIEEGSFEKTVELIHEPSKGMEIYIGDGQRFYVHHIVQNIPKKRLELHQYMEVSRYNGPKYFGKRCKEVTGKGWKVRK